MLAQAEALEDVLRAHNSHNAADLAACFVPNGVLRIIPTGDTAHGREQIEAFLEPHFRAFPDRRVEWRGVYDCSDVTWVEWAVTGTHAGELMGHAATHRGVELNGCSLLRFTSRGLITLEDMYFEPATMLRQLGLA